MNKVIADNCQQIVDDEDPTMFVSNSDEIASFCRDQDRARSLPENGQAIRDSILAELDSIEAPAIEAGFVVTCNTPAPVLEALPPEIVAALDDFELSGEEPSSESAAVRAAREKRASPEAIALHEANKAHGHIKQAQDDIDAHRKGEGRDQHNEDKRNNYAAHIFATEGREIRAHNRYATDEARLDARKRGNANSSQKRRDSMTPEQKKAESAKASERRRERKAREEAEAAAEAERQRQRYIEQSIA
jgi:hypothetical protein